MNPLRLPTSLAVVVAALGLAVATPVRLAAQESSVCPGINEEYDDPDVPAFVDRFEQAGREIFDRRHEIVAACRIRPGSTVADVGAGTGLFTRLFAPLVGERGRVYAVDTCEDFIDHVRATCALRGLKNVRGVVSAPESVGLPATSIDLAFICDTYHHFEYPFRMMHSIHEALKPGGKVVVVDYQREPGVSPEWVLRHVRAGRDTVVQEMESCGFRLVGERDLLQGQFFLRFLKQETLAPQSGDVPASPYVLAPRDAGSMEYHRPPPSRRLPVFSRVLCRLRPGRGH
jgi:predicted methyltransferase